MKILKNTNKQIYNHKTFHSRIRWNIGNRTGVHIMLIDFTQLQTS